LFTDGGNANEQVVLLDPSLKVVDAVVRSLPAESSSTITTANMPGGCGPKTFNLDSMKIPYETLGMSTGRGNSFARKLDGDCGWEKDPQQSANATNNTSGGTSDVTYSMTLVQSMDCGGTHGAVDIYVNAGSTGYAALYPMNYTVAYDANKDGKFDFSDTYTYGVDSTPPSVTVSGLIAGRYKITVASVMGCFLKTFDVTILPCGPILPLRLNYFKILNQNSRWGTLEWMLTDMETVQTVAVQRSTDGIHFSTFVQLDSLEYAGTRVFDQPFSTGAGFPYYRLLIRERDGSFFYSAIVNASLSSVDASVWPNPSTNQIHLQLASVGSSNAVYRICSATGSIVQAGSLSFQPGINQSTIATDRLPAGVYFLMVVYPQEQPIYLQFVKH
jgi:Secretion system C-terminal sorting domain